jgi:hypothetical protein
MKKIMHIKDTRLTDGIASRAGKIKVKSRK